MAKSKGDPTVVVCKFGGSSLSDAAGYRMAADIIARDPRRRFIVVSAPGRRFSEDEKITDVLIECYEAARRNEPFHHCIAFVKARFHGIISELDVSLDIDEQFDEIERIVPTCSLDHLLSRGEYLSALIMAQLVGYTFVDATHIIWFTDEGPLNQRSTQRHIRDRLGPRPNAVVPGFYGRQYSGPIQTFSRGGSDITGSLIARALRASVYENWTDTAGVHAADPRIVNESRKIPQLTFAELSELSAAGAEIFHDEAVVPVRRTGVPLHIRSTKNPDDPGTIVLPDSGGNLSASSGRITGIAGKKGYVVITLERLRMNKQVGFIRTLMETLERRGINVDHVPSGKNTLSVVIHQSEFRNDLKSLMNEVGNACQPERMYASPGVALIAVVGRGMAHSGIAGTLFAALGRAKINVRLIDQGASELSIVIGVRDSDYEASVRTIYQAFFGKGKGE